MSFSLSGSLITQSSTDTNLSGLAGVAGVTTFTLGGKTIYNLNDLVLLVNGTLTMDPRIEELWFGTACPFADNSGCILRVAGTFNIGVVITVNSVQVYPMASAIRFNTTGTYASDATNYSSMRVQTGGTINWYYGTIELWTNISAGSADGSASGALKTYSKSCYLRSLGASGGELGAQLRIRSTQTDVKGFTGLGLSTISFIGNPTRFSDAVPLHTGNSALSPSYLAPINTFLTVTNYTSGGGNALDIGYWYGRWFRHVNAANGSNLAIGAYNVANTTNNWGLVEVRQWLTLTAKDANNAPITSGGWFIIDKNSGVRAPANAVNSNTSYASDLTYSATFDGSGVAAYTPTNTGILTFVGYRTSANGNGALADTVNIKDWRNESQSNEDVFVVRVRAYGYYSQELSVPLKGAAMALTTMFANTDVAVNYATASAYTGITLADHGASPVSWNGKSYGITVTANKTTNPALTAQMIHDYLQAVIHQVGTTLHGKLGGAWHDMIYKSGSNFGTVTGKYGGTRVVKGVRVVDETGAAFPGFSVFQADDGSTYVPPVAVTLTISANVALTGAEIRIYDLDNTPAGSYGTELAGVESCPTSTYVYSGTAGNSILIQIMLDGYVEYTQSIEMPALSQTLAVVLAQDTYA